ncbi:hypothetical protein ES703_43823 [subsurface metagenome]
MKKYRILFLVLLLSLTIFRLFYIKSFNLSPDEAYYWDWSRNPSLSYYTHPPMVAYIIRIFTLIGRDSEFWVRLGAVLLALGVSILIYLLARDIFKSERIAFFSVLLLNITLGFAIGALIITPDVPLVFFWMLSLCFLYKASERGNRGWWYPLGVAVGLGLLSKYTMVLFFPCALLFLLLSGKNRKWLKCKEPYLALVIAFLIFLPVIIWNYNHGWVSFAKQLSHGLGRRGFPLRNLGDYLGSQAGIISPLLFFGLLYSMIKGFHLRTKEKRDNLLLLSCFSLPIFFFFLLTSLRSKVEANWPAMGYLSAIVLLSVFLFAIEKKRKKIALVLLIFLTSLSFTILAHSFPLLPPKIKPINWLYGWKELGREVSRLKKEMSEESFIFAPRHQLAAEIAFYTDEKYQTYEMDSQYGKDYWGNIDFLKGRDALFVTYSDYDELTFVSSHFSSLKKEKDIPIFRKGEKIKAFSIYRCRNYLGGLFHD